MVHSDIEEHAIEREKVLELLGGDEMTYVVPYFAGYVGHAEGGRCTVVATRGRRREKGEVAFRGRSPDGGPKSCQLPRLLRMSEASLVPILTLMGLCQPTFFLP